MPSETAARDPKRGACAQGHTVHTPTHTRPDLPSLPLHVPLLSLATVARRPSRPPVWRGPSVRSEFLGRGSACKTPLAPTPTLPGPCDARRRPDPPPAQPACPSPAVSPVYSSHSSANARTPSFLGTERLRGEIGPVLSARAREAMGTRTMDKRYGWCTSTWDGRRPLQHPHARVSSSALPCCVPPPPSECTWCHPTSHAEEACVLSPRGT